MAGTIVASTINNDTGLFSTNNAYSGIAKAWINYNGNTNTILGSFNVSSITVNGTGDYSVNFTTAMPNSTYSAVYSETCQVGGSYGFGGINSQTASAVRITSMNNGGGGQNAPLVNCIVISS